MNNEKDFIEELDGPIELIDDEGNKNEYYHIGTMDFEGKKYAFFQPGDTIEGADPEEVVIFEIDEENNLLPIEDDEYLEKIFERFQIEYNEQFADEETDGEFIN